MGGRGTTSRDRYKSTGAKSADTPAANINDAANVIKRFTSAQIDDALEYNDNISKSLKYDIKEKTLIEDYSENAHQDINSYLRKGASPEYVYDTVEEVANAVKNLDAIMSRHKSKDNLLLYRIAPASLSDNLAPGVEFTDKGYGSHSLLKSEALKFEGSKVYKSGFKNTLFEVVIPKGTKAIHLGSNLSAHPNEAEVLVNRLTKYRTLTVREDKSTQTRHVRIVAIGQGS